MTIADIITYLHSTDIHLMLAEIREKREFEHDLIVEERKALHEAMEKLKQMESLRPAIVEECIDALRPEYPDAAKTLQMRMGKQEG